MKSHPNASESWMRPSLDTMSCNESSKIEGAGQGGLGVRGWGTWLGYAMRYGVGVRSRGTGQVGVG